MADVFNGIAERVADKVGSPLSILIHVVLFTVNLALLFFFDVNRVLLIFATWLSVEAIVLQLFTQLVVTNEKKTNDKKR